MRIVFVRLALTTTLLTAAWLSPLMALEQRKKPQPPATQKDDPTDAVAKYCTNIATTAAEQRARALIARLEALRNTVDQRIADLEAREAQTRAWIEKRDESIKKASDDVVAIYGKMKPESAAAQLAEMEMEFAAAILGKLNARAASTILNDMSPANAARLTAAIASRRPSNGNKS